MGKKLDIKAEFKIVKVPLPPEMVEARRASLLMLLKWFQEARKIYESKKRKEWGKGGGIQLWRFKK